MDRKCGHLGSWWDIFLMYLSQRASIPSQDLSSAVKMVLN